MWNNVVCGEMLRGKQGGYYSSPWLKYIYPEWFALDMEKDYRENPMSFVAPTNAFLHAEFHPESGSNHLVALASEETVFVADCRRKYSVVKLAAATLPLDIKWVPHTASELLYPGTQTSLYHWDIEADSIEDMNLDHGATIRSLACYNKHIFSSSCRAGTIRTFDMRMRKGKTTSCIVDAHSTNSKPLGSASSKAVACVLYHSQYQHHLISCGSTDGKIKVWDSRKHYSRSHANPQSLYTYEYCGPGRRPYGFTHMCIDSTGNRLFAYCMDQSLYAYNVSTHTNHNLPEYIYDMSEHMYTSSCDLTGKMYTKLSMSPDDRYLLTGSCSGAAFILQADDVNAPAVELPSAHSPHSHPRSPHSQDVPPSDDDVMCCCAVAWNRHDMNMVVTGDDNGGVHVWRCKPMPHGECEPTSSTGQYRYIQARRTGKCDSGVDNSHVGNNNKFMQQLRTLRVSRQEKEQNQGKGEGSGNTFTGRKQTSLLHLTPCTRTRSSSSHMVGKVEASAILPVTPLTTVSALPTAHPLPHSAAAPVSPQKPRSRSSSSSEERVSGVGEMLRGLPNEWWALHPTLHTYLPSPSRSPRVSAVSSRVSAVSSRVSAVSEAVAVSPLHDTSLHLLNTPHHDGRLVRLQQRKRKWWESAGFKRRASPNPTPPQRSDKDISDGCVQDVG